MQPFTRHTGIAVPLPRANIDTDLIIRIERFMLVPRRELGAYAFEMLRHRSDGSTDPDCPLNQPCFAGASILIAGANFGCGSSREAAVWALAGMGIRSVIAPSFGDIFRENCVKNGILPIVLDAAACEELSARLLTGEGGHRISIDLTAQRLTPLGGQEIPFAIGAFEREQLLAGEDEVATTLRRRRQILDHLDRWEAAEPWSRLILAGSPLLEPIPSTLQDHEEGKTSP